MAQKTKKYTRSITRDAADAYKARLDKIADELKVINNDLYRDQGLDSGPSYHTGKALEEIFLAVRQVMWGSDYYA